MDQYFAGVQEMKPAKDGVAFDLGSFLPPRLGSLARLTQDLLASVLAESGLSVAQWRVFLCLDSRGPSHLNGIAEFTRLPQSSLSRSIAQLAERGLVRNSRNEIDRRIASIELTDLGREHHERLTARMQEVCDAVFLMNPKEEAAFRRTIDQLIERISAYLGAAPA
jgi:DNA-binding MarR family transcriptional regulator